MAYTNFWTERNKRIEAEADAVLAAHAERAGLLDDARERRACAALNKSGLACKGFATDTGLCAGHQNAVDNGKDVALQAVAS